MVKLCWMERSDNPKVNGAIGLAKFATASLLTGLVLNRLPLLRHLLAPVSALELVAFETVPQDNRESYYKQLEMTPLDKSRILPLLRGLQLMTIVSLARGIRASLSTSRWEAMLGMGVLALALTAPCVTAWRAKGEAYLENETGRVLFGKWLGTYPRKSS